MKKITHLSTLIILLIGFTSCSGYKPIFSSSNLKFEIAEYSIKGNKKLGNRIYSKLFNLSVLDKSNLERRSVNISIDISKDKNATVKNNEGKILEYKISLDSNILIKDFLTEEIILNHNFNTFLSYRVQDQHSETVKLENEAIKNLLNQTYQNLLISMSENILEE